MTTFRPRSVNGIVEKKGWIVVSLEFLKKFLAGEYDLADVVHTMYHEFVHVKQILEMDGYKTNLIC